ncbi:MAG: DNA polymerase III subunit gamma and tau [Humibacillus sp.]|nr:DNA polymerase III subunit gamma and tau [Humibacillus sp.]MDN5775627.1 DNA polymerase III subunit gamma and tau [Humibacillus sp.]
MATALYRRYRPETFADVIGQEHVTEPLMQALRTGRVNHAYLFSGPRGCGKTTSARILARCLNCEQGPTPTPCGVCDSCVALARGGAGSVDVIEIDAASHGGVDDARDLRERASYGPAQSRYKIYIIDEAHMVTPQGFNALLKIVEEPPEHVKFVFATTEPEKVIGTIRSRTHHYPFRLVPPAKLAEYMQRLCDQERVRVAPGVLSFVTRAGGGSVRDSLSVLDQLISGSGDEGLTYDGAVSLLGFTDGELLDATIDALAAHDGAATFRQVDKVIESGHDPRRFVEDLLERLRDLIIVAAVPEGAGQVLRGTPEDQLERMRGQQAAFGQGTLSRAADIVNAGLTEMTGANSPRLQLELICARILLPAASGEQGYAARLDRLERRLDVGGVPSAARGPVGPSGSQQQAQGAPPVGMPQSSPPPGSGPGAAWVSGPASAPTRTVTDRTPPHASVTGTPDRTANAAGGMGGVGRSDAVDRLVGADPSGSSRQNPASWPAPPATTGQQPERPAGQHDAQQIDRARHEAGGLPVTTPSQSVGGPSAVEAPPGAPAPRRPGADNAATGDARRGGDAGGREATAPSGESSSQGSASGGMDTDAIRRAWPDVLGRISGMRRATWTFVSQHAQVMAYDGRTLTLGIGTVGLTNTFRSGNHAELVRQALIDELGVDAIVDGIPLPEQATEANPGPGAAVSGAGGSAGFSGGAHQGEPHSQPPSGQSGPPPGSGGGPAPRGGSPGATPGRSLENNPGWANVTSPAPDWASDPAATDAVPPGRGSSSGSAPAAGRTHASSAAPSDDRRASASGPDPGAPRRGANAVRESLAGARSGTRPPDEPEQTGRDDLGDDAAVSDDDENIEVSGDVGRSVVERVFGGRVLSESDD